MAGKKKEKNSSRPTDRASSVLDITDSEKKFYIKKLGGGGGGGGE